MGIIGCDIHCYMEIKLKGEWVFIGYMPSQRSYDEFSKMSGVRGGDIPFFPMADVLPNDCTLEMRNVLGNPEEPESFELEDGLHSLTIASYFNVKTFNKKFHQGTFGFVPMAVAWEKIMTKSLEVAEDARIIFAYDN